MRSQGPQVKKFFETFLTLGGSFSGRPYKVLPFAEKALNDIYLLDKNGRRIRRTNVVGVPRKNTKSIMGAGVALHQLIVDKADTRPQVISAAGDRDQAKLVFNEAKRMVLAHPELEAACRVMRDEIHCIRNGGIYKVVSADAGLAHGLNPSCVVFDEYHVFRNDELYVALTSGSGMRNQPMTLVISTAGYDIDGPFGQLYQKGRRIESGEVVDPSFGFTWFGPEEDEIYDPGDPAVWERFNPAWPILNHKEFEDSYRNMPLPDFIRFRLNGWVSKQGSWLPSGAWRTLGDEGKQVSPSDPVILGFDGSWRNDCTALVGVRISDLHVFTIDLWEAPLDDPQWRVPINEVKGRIIDACASMNVREIVADPARWQVILHELSERNLPIVEFPNSPSRMVPATQSFYESVSEGDLSHDGNPSMSRHVGNCVLKSDARGSRITKENKSSRKFIDLAVAAVMAHFRARLYKEKGAEPSIIVL